MGYLTGIVAYDRLPGSQLVAFFLPTAALTICGLLRRIWARDPIRSRDPQTEQTYEAIVTWIALFLAGLQALLLLGLSGALAGGAWLARAVLVLLGLVLVGVGNLLPRTRPNLVIGIRTGRTIRDRRVWMQTHRMTGYVVVSVGVVIAASGLLLSKATIPKVVGTAGLVGAGVVLMAYRKQPDA
jgi:uncharacterized membrane protein